MKSLKEISEEIRETINQFLEAVDGAESLLDKAIVDMKVRLDEAKDLVAIAMVDEQTLKRAYQEAIDTANVWGKKADAALKDQDTTRAREAQRRRQHHLNLADGYKRQIAAQAAVVTTLKTALHEFYQQFRTAAGHAETLSHRQKQAETRSELYKLIATAENTLSTAFTRAERKLKIAEKKAEMWENRNRHDATDVPKNADDSNIDRVLAELKSDVLGSNRKSTTQT